MLMIRLSVLRWRTEVTIDRIKMPEVFLLLLKKAGIELADLPEDEIDQKSKPSN